MLFENNYPLLKIYAILLKLGTYNDNYKFTEKGSIKNNKFLDCLRELMFSDNNCKLMKNAMLDNIEINIPIFSLRGFDPKARRLHLTVYYPVRNDKSDKEVEDIIKKYNILKKE
jgi:hypothetical protein